MSNRLTGRRRFRIFNFIDDFNRESLAIEGDTSLATLCGITVLERLDNARRLYRGKKMAECPESYSNAHLFTSLAEVRD